MESCILAKSVVVYTKRSLKDLELFQCNLGYVPKRDRKRWLGALIFTKITWLNDNNG